MEYQIYVNVIGGAALAALGWFARQLWDAIGKLRTDLDAHRVKVAEDYVTRVDFKGAVDAMRQEMRDGFNRLFDRLDQKADK